MQIVGKRLTPAEFKAHVAGLDWSNWKPTMIALHNTAVPSLAQRPAPDALTAQHIQNLRRYYEGMGWGAGPHLFVDDNGIWLFTPLNQRGVHSPSWNGFALGIEQLGDFAKEEYTSGRGAKVRANAIFAMATLNVALGLKAEDFKFHVQDTRSNHDCPGIKCRNDRANIVAEIQAQMKAHTAPPKKPWIPVFNANPPAPVDNRQPAPTAPSLGRQVWDWWKAH